MAQQLYSLQKQDLYSWKDNHNKEIEFLYQHTDIIPIEVKAAKKSATTQSLKDYIKKYHPRFAIKIAPRNFGVHDKIISLPIYFIERINELSEDELEKL